MTTDDKDLSFLYEIKKRLDDFLHQGNSRQIDYVATMINDWIGELEIKKEEE